ncbi:protein phosphatase CheZ, partial [Rhodothermus profundi]
MTTHHIQDLLSKLNELRAVFILGQRAIPFIEEVVYFLREISPLLSEVNDSLTESTRKMPRASSQLKSVTQATEMATTEILDLIDVVLSDLDAFKKSWASAPEILQTLQTQEDQLWQHLPESWHEQLQSLLEERRQHYTALQNMLESQHQLIDSLRDRMNRIMLALQVQDITAQQLAAVNHLIESVRHRMAQLIQRLGGEVLDGLELSQQLFAEGTFDPHARYDRDGARQERVDALVEALQNNAPLPSDETATTPASQEEIDALFNNSGGTPASQDEI